MTNPNSAGVSGNAIPDITAANLGKIVFDPLEYVVDPILTPGATILAGRPKTNKTWFAQELALSVANGDEACGAWPTEQGDVLYLALEDNPRRVQERLKRMRPDSDLPANLTFRWQSKQLGDGFREELKKWTSASKAPKLVVVDTYQFVLRPQSTPSYRADYQESGMITHIANEFGVSIFAIHHTKKGEADDALDAVSGTTGITAGFDSVFGLRRNAEGSFTLTGRGRDILQQDIALSFDEMSAQWSVLGAPELAHASVQRKAIIDYLNEQGEASPIGIAKKLGLSHDSVRQLLPKMVKRGLITKIAKGSYGPVHTDHTDHSGDDE